MDPWEQAIGALCECSKGELVGNRECLGEELGVYSAIKRKPFCFV